jgi:hypothetical protein
MCFSKQDSTSEYLRLLVMTAVGDAGGTSKRFGLQLPVAVPSKLFCLVLMCYNFISFSIRDLALILDALLHTKSGAVLLGIINMNGIFLSFCIFLYES